MKYDFTAIEAKWHKIWDEKQLYAALVQHHLDIQSLSCEESFIDGFRLGARLILEIFSEADGCLRALV